VRACVCARVSHRLCYSTVPALIPIDMLWAYSWPPF